MIKGGNSYNRLPYLDFDKLIVTVVMLNFVAMMLCQRKGSSIKILQGRTGEIKMSGGPADLPALLEEVRDMADRGGRLLL